MTSNRAWDALSSRIVRCRACPRLVSWREDVARTRTRRFSDQTYWGRPVPGFGDRRARLLLVGLAPAAHGANRTGRMFTGDRSGDWLYRALHRFGFSSMPDSTAADDGLHLTDCYITATCRCAPPGNKPLPEEIAACRPYLEREFSLLRDLRVVVGLGKQGFESARSVLDVRGAVWPRRPVFAHGSATRSEQGIWLLGSYHPSQQNTFTGRLTTRMFNDVFRRAVRILSNP